MNIYWKLILDFRLICIDGPIQNCNTIEEQNINSLSNTIYHTHTPSPPIRENLKQQILSRQSPAMLLQLHFYRTKNNPAAVFILCVSFRNRGSSSCVVLGSNPGNISTELNIGVSQRLPEEKMAVELAPAMLLHHRVLQAGVSESNTKQSSIRLLSLVWLLPVRGRARHPQMYKSSPAWRKADR